MVLVLNTLLVDVVGLDALCTESFKSNHQKLTEHGRTADLQTGDKCDKLTLELG